MSDRIRIYLAGSLLLLALAAAVVVRFAALERAPAGFYIDEAAIAAQALCIARSGHSAQGELWPLYADVLGGGQASPTLLYPAAAWSQIAGESISALRALGVSLGVLMLACIVGAAAGRAHWSLYGGLGLLCLSNPWWFAASRVFWDPVFGAACWGLGLAAYWRLRLEPAASWRYAGALCVVSLLLVAAAYAYPPVRIQLLLSVVLVLLWDGRRLMQARWALGLPLGLGGALLSPLMAEYLSGSDFSGRAQMLAVWNPGWMHAQGLSAWDLPGVILHNLWRHLDPAYLWLQGDSNLRHSAGLGGVLGPPEASVLITTLLLAPRALWHRDSLLLIALSVAGIVPAALTWEGLPHALRSLGAVGPLLLWLCVNVSHLHQQLGADHRRRLLLMLCLISSLSLLRFGHYYFGSFANQSQAWFAGQVAPADYSDDFALARLYYELRSGQASCPANPRSPAYKHSEPTSLLGQYHSKPARTWSVAVVAPGHQMGCAALRRAAKAKAGPSH